MKLLKKPRAKPSAEPEKKQGRPRWALPALALVTLPALALVTLLALAAVGMWLLHRPKAPLVIAVAESFSGKAGYLGPQVLRGEQMCMDDVNRTGGVDGHPIRLQIFDDQSSPAVAVAGVKDIAASPALVVLGHFSSPASAAAGPGYRDAHIPALAGTATADAVTQNNPYYFRSMYTVSAQARQVAQYLDDVLYVPSVTVVYSDDVLGRSYLAGFQAYRGKSHVIAYDSSNPNANAAIQSVINSMEYDSQQDSMLVLAMTDSVAHDVLLAVRRAGLTMPIMGHRDIARVSFAEGFASEPEEQAHPGFFTDGIMAPTPLMLDSLGEGGQTFVEEYQKRYGSDPDWVEARAYEAAKILVHALQQAHVQDTLDAKRQDREAVRSQLAAMNSPANSIAGLGGPLFFNAQRSMDIPIRMGQFKRRQFYSAPLQLVPIDHPEVLDMENLVASGRVLKEDDRYFWRQRVVYTGLDINKISRLDFKANTFSADLFLWMRYAGDDAPTRIALPGLVKQEDFKPQEPLEASDDEGLHYRLYRLSGEFKASYDLHSYPFDTQDLRLQLQNNVLSRDQVAYVTDVRGLHGEDNNQPYQSLTSWQFKGIHYTVDSLVSDSTRGRTEFFNTPARIDYPGFSAHVVMRRVYSVFMLKSMVALGLLTLLVFSTLFLGSTFSKERLTIPVTAILASAVLLTGINNQVSDVGYIMAIEYAFYVFFALCLLVMIITIAEHPKSATQKVPPYLNLSGKIMYVTLVLGTVLYFWVSYAHS